MKRKILVVDDEKSMRDMLKILFEKEGFEAETAENGEEALRLVSEKVYDLVLSDIRMGKVSGLDLLREIKNQSNPPQVVLMTAYASTETAVEALKLGAVDYIIKPFDVNELLHRVKSAIEKKSLLEENIELRAELSKEEGFEGIIGNNQKMLEIYSLIQRIAPTNSTVLIQGESGTGKELIAKAIHYNSLRKNKPFISINCGGLPETLLESELFGYIKGAFTGAYASKRGLFDVAEGGSLFLDEIGDMTPLMQTKLLRAIQERKIRPVGSTSEHSIDVRLITATNKDLLALVKENSFREDLYYRINVIKIEVPPLRERKDDIPILLQHFIEKYSQMLRKAEPQISKEAVKILEEYNWPGNVRELENVVERALALDQNGVFEPSLLPDNIKGGRVEQKREFIEIPEEGFSLEKAKDDFEIKLIKRALELENGNMTKAAKRLGITYRSLRHLVNSKHREHFKEIKNS
jgi:two-component system response regulator PilR (NtrC family)